MTLSTSARPWQGPAMAGQLQNTSLPTFLALLHAMHDCSRGHSSALSYLFIDILYWEQSGVAGSTWHAFLSRIGLIPERAAGLICFWTGSCQHDSSNGIRWHLLRCLPAGSAAVKQVVRCCPENVALALKRELVRLLFDIVSACLWHTFWLITRCVAFSSNYRPFVGTILPETLEHPTCKGRARCRSAGARAPLRTTRRYQSSTQWLAGRPDCLKTAGLSFPARHEIC